MYIFLLQSSAGFTFYMIGSLSSKIRPSVLDLPRFWCTWLVLNSKKCVESNPQNAAGIMLQRRAAGTNREVLRTRLGFHFILF